MYVIEETTENDYSLLVLKNTNNNSVAQISLEEGGRLQKLMLNNINLISNQPNFEYKDSFASAILFPFANRIEKGKYTFNENNFQFNCNENGRKNAIHGLIYNKKFSLFEKKISSNSCAVTVCYSEKNESAGFPYKYSIYLTYILSKENIELKVTVKNEDSKAFPFTLGWHPYFMSDDLNKSSLNFKSDKKVAFNESLITKKIENFKSEEIIIKNKQLDDCYILNSEKVAFHTPNYQIEISTNQIENYLQLYTPKGLSIIAIEPMTGISNSFNNKIGLQILESNKTFSLSWNVKLMKKETY